jgi:molybdate transport repressor ModE-like protein
MIKISAYAELRFTHGSGDSITLSEIVPLLEQISQLGSIAAAAEQVGLSYRHAWGRMRTMEALLGGALISKSRGRGSVLSELGEKLLWAHQLSGERLQNVLGGLCREVSQELDKLLLPSGDAARIHASHGYAVDALVEALQLRHTAVDLRYRDSIDAVASLARGESDLAGFHLPRGEFRESCAAVFRPLLDDTLHVLIHLTRRTQGLFIAQGNPKGVRGLADMSRKDMRFVNRQRGSGTRILLDLLLRKNGVDPDQVHSQTSTELTHSAIAAFVASGMADMGFGVEPAARHFGLEFIPIVDEDYYFVCERAKLGSEPLKTILAILQADTFKAKVSRLAGYDGTLCGEVIEVGAGLGPGA